MVTLLARRNPRHRQLCRCAGGGRICRGRGERQDCLLRVVPDEQEQPRHGGPRWIESRGHRGESLGRRRAVLVTKRPEARVQFLQGLHWARQFRPRRCECGRNRSQGDLHDRQGSRKARMVTKRVLARIHHEQQPRQQPLEDHDQRDRTHPIAPRQCRGSGLVAGGRSDRRVPPTPAGQRVADRLDHPGRWRLGHPYVTERPVRSSPAPCMVTGRHQDRFHRHRPSRT